MRYYENVEKTAENRLPQRAYYIPEGTADFLLLNGVWDFQYFENGDRVKPVSYTHLDVYKRQIKASIWSPFWCLKYRPSKYGRRLIVCPSFHSFLASAAAGPGQKWAPYSGRGYRFWPAVRP